MIQLTDKALSADAGTGAVNPSIEQLYGPYNSLAEAKQAVANTIQEVSSSGVPLGVTIAVKEATGLVEYWNPTTSDTWVKKQASSTGGTPPATGSGGGTGSVYEVTAINSDTVTTLNGLFPAAKTGDWVVDTSTGGSYLKFGDGKWIKFNGTILTEVAIPVATVVGAQVLSYK